MEMGRLFEDVFNISFTSEKVSTDALEFLLTCASYINAHYDQIGDVIDSVNVYISDDGVLSCYTATENEKLVLSSSDTRAHSIIDASSLKYRADDYRKRLRFGVRNGKYYIC